MARHCLTGLLAIGLLAACKGGGSGGGGGGGVDITPGGSGVLGSYYVNDFSPFESAAATLRASARYMRQANAWFYGGQLNSYPLASARIEYAHAVGLTGEGQTIAISDGGFLTSHETLRGKNLTTVGSLPVDDHGTTVASIAAGDSSRMIGVAPGADLILGRYDDQYDLADTADMARVRGAVALNNSWGYTGTTPSMSSFNAIFSGADGTAYLAALRAYAGQGVVVFALSNDENDTRSGLMAALPVLDPSLEAGWLAVGNAVPVYNSSRVLSATRLSAGCLEAAEWCLVADGFWDAADAAGWNSYSTGTGSSFAAPQVSGALALLAEAFPDLTPHELRIRLLASADNGWFTADGSVELAAGFWHDYSEEFGHGFLDLRAALLPIGTTTLSVNGAAMPLEEAAVRQGSAVGDAVERALAGVSLEVTDSLAAGFALDGAVMATEAAPLPLAARIATRPAGHAADPVAGFAEFSGTEVELALAEAPLTLRLLMPPAEGGSLGLSVTRRFGDEDTGLELGLSLARDGGEVFGLGGGRAGDGTTMAALSVGFDARLGDTGFVRLGAEAGVADASGGGMLGQVGSLGVNAFSAEIGARDVFGKGDRLVLGISAPMAVTSGSATTQISTRSAGGQVLLSDMVIPLAPEDREQVLSLGYETPLSARASLRLDLAHAENWGNRSGQSDTAAGLTLRISF